MGKTKRKGKNTCMNALHFDLAKMNKDAMTREEEKKEEEE